jgi:hypothetical protein
MRTTRATIIPASLLAATVLAACGGDDGRNAKRFDGDKKDVAAVVDELEKASREDEPDRICGEIFSDELERLVASQEGEGGCEKRIKREQIDEKARIDVQSLEVDGKKANAVVREQDGDQITLNFVKKGDEWEILSIVP